MIIEWIIAKLNRLFASSRSTTSAAARYCRRRFPPRRRPRRWLPANPETSRRSNTLIEHNLRLVVFLARKFESSGVGTEDLISIGTIGLIKAVSTYRSDKNVKLATYASRCIENEILMHLRKIAGRRTEVSLDEPLSSDWDGNELLLSDILGTEPDSVLRPLEDDVDRTLLLHALAQPACARAENHLHAVRPRPARGDDPEGSRRPDGHFAELHITSGKAHYLTDAPGHPEKLRLRAAAAPDFMPWARMRVSY